MTPLIGWDGARLFFHVLNAVWLITAAQGVYELGGWVLKGAHLIYKGTMPALFERAPAAALAAIVIAALAGEHFGNSRRENIALREAVTARGIVADADERGLLGPGPVITDRPGWLAHQGKRRVIDLTGEVTVRVLAMVNADGSLDSERLRQLARQENAATLMLWGPGQDEIKRALGARPISLPDAAP
jgi:hypothetical protein